MIQLSTRGNVGAGENVMIAGFALDTRQSVRIQARGPSLASAGIAHPLMTPTLDLWAGQTHLGTGVGTEPEMTVTLDQGLYTAIVGGGEGVAIVEVTEVSTPIIPPIVLPDYLINTQTPVPAPSGPPGATMGEQPGQPPYPGHGGGPCGSYEVALGSCSQGMTGANAIKKAWLYVLEDGLIGRLGNSIRVGVPRDQALIFRFRTGANPHTLGIAFEENTVRGPMAPRFVTVSEVRGDFDRTKIGTDARYQQFTGGGGFVCQVGQTGTYPYAQLKPETVYYINIRCEGNPGEISLAEPTLGQSIGFN